MVRWNTESVNKFVEKIHERKYFLPNIQREKFVWEMDQITKLFDSLLRGYPIGVLLLWEIKKGTDIKKRSFVQHFKENINPSDFIDTSPINEDIFLVLDGQQRLQSFYIGLKGTYEGKELFFNVLSGKEENEDGLLYEFDFLKSEKNFFRDNEKIWVKLKWIDWSKKPYNVSDFLKEQEELKITESEAKQIFNNLCDLFDAITRDDKVTYFKVDESDENKVLDIFVRVNSGGTPLSKADLLFSIIKLGWKIDAQTEFNELIELLNDNGRFRFNMDFILKTCLVLTATKQQDVRYDIRNFKVKERLEKIEQNWESIKSSIKITVDLIKEFWINSHKLLPSVNALIPIIYYAYVKKLKIFNSIDKERIKKWLINALLSGVFGGQSDTVLYLSKKAIDDNAKSDAFPSKEIIREISEGTKGKKSAVVNENILNKIKYGDNKSYLVLFLIYPSNKINFKALDKRGRPQQDHIFSQNELRNANLSEEKINDIGNIRLVTTYENQSKGDKPFREWVENISEEERELHFIPPKEYWDSYEKFLARRKDMMLEKILDFT
jgi:uncharacterized protein with ParB-like and HNH nuclease domain